MGSRRRWLKRKAVARAAAASEAAGDSVPVLKRKRNQPIASDSDYDETKILKLEEACPSEEGKILKLKKEFMAANEASAASIPFFTEENEAKAALDLAQPQPDGKTTKRKKTKKVLIKRIVPTRVMESFKERLFTIIPDECILSDDELAKHSQQFQESYAENMDLMTKMRAWQKALLEQYDRFGYAVDELEAEVTDGEDDDDDVRNPKDDGVKQTEREKTGRSKEKNKKKAASSVAPGTVHGPEEDARPKRAKKPNPRNAGPEWQRP